VKTSDCNNNDHGLGCQKYGLLYYPKCQVGYSAVGCCVCTWGGTGNGMTCPSGWQINQYNSFIVAESNGVLVPTNKEIVVFESCQKPTNARTGETSMICNSTVQDTINGYCYIKQSAAYTCGIDVGDNTPINYSICWANQCPTKYPYKCANFLCVASSSQCTTSLQELMPAIYVLSTNKLSTTINYVNTVVATTFSVSTGTNYADCTLADYESSISIPSVVPALSLKL